MKNTTLLLLFAFSLGTTSSSIAKEGNATKADNLRAAKSLAAELAPPPAKDYSKEKKTNKASNQPPPSAETESTPTTSSKIYKTTDKYGNVVFTDKPGDGDKKEVQVGTTNTMPFPKASPSKLKAKDEAINWQISISSPIDQATFRNLNTPLTVTVQTSPTPQEGELLRLIHNGNALPEQSGKNFVFKQLPRGEHIFTAQVVSKAGDILAKSTPVTLYMHRTSRKQ